MIAILAFFLFKIVFYLFNVVQSETLIQPFTLSLNFKNIHTATPNQHNDIVFLTSNSTPARIGVVNLRTFVQVEQVLLIRNVWIQSCDYCYSRNLLFCLAKDSDGDELKMLRINQNKHSNNTIVETVSTIPNVLATEPDLEQQHATSKKEVNEVGSRENFDKQEPYKKHNETEAPTVVQNSESISVNTRVRATRESGETEFDEITVAAFGFPVICSVSEDDDFMYVAYSDMKDAYKQGIYVVDKDTIKVHANSTFKAMNGASNHDIQSCSVNIKIFVYQDFIYTICNVPPLNGKERTLLYIVGREDLHFHSTIVIPMKVTGQYIRDGTVDFMALTTVFFFSDSMTKLIPYNLLPFDRGEDVELPQLINGGVSCAVMDGLQQYAYLFTTGPLVSILKFSLQAGKVVDTYNIHNAGNVSTCFLGRSGKYLYFAQNLLDTSALIEFSLEAFVPNEIIQMEQLPVSFIINGALTTVDTSVVQKSDSSLQERRMYLVTETSPGKIIEISIEANGELTQTNFLNLPEDHDSGIKAQPIFNDLRSHAYFARASSPSVLYQVDLRNLQIVYSLQLPPHLSTVVTALKSKTNSNVGIFATATSPSYVFTVCLQSLTVISEGVVTEERLSLFSAQSEDGKYAFFVTDSLPATVLKVDLENIAVVERYTLHSYPTCTIDSEDIMWLGLRSGRVVSISKHNLSSISYSSSDMGGVPLSCVRDTSGKFGIFAIEQFSTGTTLVKMDLDIERMSMESSTFLDVRGMYRTAFLDERDHFAYFINYGPQTTIVPVSMISQPVDLWILALVILTCVFILGLLFTLGLYINLRKRWWMRNRAEREIRKKLLQHDGLSTGTPSYGSFENGTNWVIPPEDITLQNRVSEGAYGMVFKGIWQGTVVAIKKIKIIGAQFSEHTDSLFTREVKVMRSLRHPNIVQFLGVSLLEDEQRFIVTEYVPNGDLSRYIRTIPGEPPLLSLATRIKILEDISKGMLYLHSLSPPLIHRDLKPSNILLDSAYTAKVCDFGLSAHNKQITMTGNIGTIQFMSNEVISETKYDQSADVYSFGILCYEVIFLREAFAESNCFKLGMEILNGRRPIITNEMICDDVVLSELSELMKQCWDADPQARPSFKAILSTLHRIQKEKKKLDAGLTGQLRIN